MNEYDDEDSLYLLVDFLRYQRNYWLDMAVEQAKRLGILDLTGSPLGSEYEQAMSERDARHPWPDPLER